MIKKYAARSMEIIAFAVIDSYPMAIYFRNAVGATWVERSGFCLRHFCYFAKHLTRTRLIKSNLGVYDTNRIKHSSNT